MNIVEILKTKNIHTGIKYYGLDDMATGISVKSFLDGYNTILSHYNNYQITNVNEYIDYIYLENILNYKEVIPYVIEEHQDDFIDFLNQCEVKFDNYKKSELVKYLKKGYKDVFNYEPAEKVPLLKHDLWSYTIKIIPNYINSFSEDDIDYLLNNKTYGIIDNFEFWEKYFTKNEKKLSILFSTENLKATLYMRYQSIFDILLLFENKPAFEEIIPDIVDNIYSIIYEKYYNIEDDKLIWESYYTLSDCLTFFKKIGSKYVYDIQKELTKQEKIFNDSLVKNGKSISFQLDLEPFKKFYEDFSKNRLSRIIFITHNKNKTGEMFSFIEKSFLDNNEGSFDILSRKNPGTNEVFTNSKLRNLSLYTFEIKGRISIILSSEDNIKDYICGISEEIKNICDNTNTDYKQEIFDENMEMLKQYLLDLSCNKIEKDSVNMKNLYYGISMFLCGLVEKVLRIIYKDYISGIMYLPDKSITLGKLLDNKEIIRKTLGDMHSDCLKYFFGKIDDNANVGLNIRNDLAHLNGKTMSLLSYDLVLEILSYFTCTINTIVLYYNNKNS
ncbi:MAG: hypothetical protein ACI31R_04055 [Bacilli bacterium]